MKYYHAEEIGNSIPNGDPGDMVHAKIWVHANDIYKATEKLKKKIRKYGDRNNDWDLVSNDINNIIDEVIRNG